MKKETEVKPDETHDCIELFCPIPVFNTTEAINTINISRYATNKCANQALTPCFYPFLFSACWANTRKRRASSSFPIEAYIRLVF